MVKICYRSYPLTISSSNDLSIFVFNKTKWTDPKYIPRNPEKYDIFPPLRFPGGSMKYRLNLDIVINKKEFDFFVNDWNAFMNMDQANLYSFIKEDVLMKRSDLYRTLIRTRCHQEEDDIIVYIDLLEEAI